ncbi:hypothetical protein GGTG_13864 [Gaeumannomyces tritici R3-111a-1]|uniref:Uncharacterized protein n=1 Tax=Gaeumannomyces tritici (strain R3-111a-1) TaxID=644352 RepID=J3PK18_GAET3|nr:hypothetical protein GGTG_13864 [Gaeumannomyces tritici R3-111a-1]EJT68566.1 hypothetical protein GGTG_13864 [Gaeumannomyces tritici R3-111a-1]
MRLSVINTVLSSKCHEEIYNYLKNIEFIYSRILSNKEMFDHLDEHAVKALEGKSPKRSKYDRALVKSILEEGRIFPLLSYTDRERIFRNLCDINFLIPSLYTFFEDVKHLDTCARSIKHLLDSSKPTVSKALLKAFRIDKDGAYRDTGDFLKEFAAAKRKIWLYAGREFPALPPQRREMNKPLLAKATASVDKLKLFEFAVFANKLLFTSNKINDIIRNKPLNGIHQAINTSNEMPSEIKN